MQLPHPRRWLRSVLLVCGLIGVVLGWFVALIVDRVAGLRHRWSRWGRVVLSAHVAILAAGASVAAIDGEIRPLVILGSISLLLVFALFAAGLLSSSDAREDDPLLQTYPRTTWRLCDPELSTGGVWRAEIESYPLGTDDLGNPELVEPYVHSLVRDWSFRSGWPFLWSRVLRISQASPGKTGPFSSVSEWWTVYRVTLDVDVDPRECGWLHFGNGFAEFQLEPHPTRPTTRLIVGARTEVNFWEKPAAEKAESGVEQELTPSVTALQNPLWDRWLDG
jgi:hypothetical protein